MSNGNSALALPNGKIYLFHGTTYDRYAFETGTLEQSGLSIADNWPGLRANAPDAALYYGCGKAYFFYGNEYLRYELGSNGAEGGEPEWLPPNSVSISTNWDRVWADGVDCAVNWLDGKIYFFRGSQYLRYDVARDRVDDGYPATIADEWPGLFTDGIEGAVYQGGKYAWFFKGGDYCRYDVAADRVDVTGNIASLVFELVPAAILKAARDLSPAEANLITGYLIQDGKLSLASGYTGDWQTGISSPAVGQHVVVKPPTINGVDFVYFDPSIVQTIIDNVDQRMLVVLYRLTRWMNATHDPSVSAILHKGIGHGRGAPNDCHNQGRALDFAGPRGVAGGVAFQHLVMGEWGHAPMPPPPALQLDPSVVDPVTYDLFRRVFAFANLECESNAIGAANRWPPKRLGDVGGYVCHPDYINGPGESLREQHQDHVHMQVGPTHA